MQWRVVMKMGVSELAAEVEVGAEEAAELEVRAEVEGLTRVDFNGFY